MTASYPSSVKSFTTKTDLVNIIYAADVNGIQDEVIAIETALRQGLPEGHAVNAESITANKTLVDADLAIQSLSPNADRDVNLPSVATTNHGFYIMNRSSSYKLTVKNAGGTTIGTISPTKAALFASDGANAWKQISGGGNAITTGTYASLPATANEGDMYVPTDSPYDKLIYNGTSWDAFLPGIGKASPVPTSDWSWDNQEGSTVTTAYGGIKLSAEKSVTNYDFRIYYRTAPATPYTIKMGVSLQLFPVNYHYAGIGFRESSSGKLVLWNFYSQSNSSISSNIYNFTDPNTIGSAVLSVTTPNNNQIGSGYVVLWLALTNDGTTNRKWAQSFNGVDWFEVHSETYNANITPDQICLCADSVGTSATVPEAKIHLLSYLEESGITIPTT